VEKPKGEGEQQGTIQDEEGNILVLSVRIPAPAATIAPGDLISKAVVALGRVDVAAADRDV